jgi:hypothetical protein
MVTINVSIDIPAPVAIVWNQIADISTHVDWMADAEEIEFVGSRTSGVGTSFLCRTRIGPFTTTDRMEVTGWIPESEMSVEHVGLFTGSGRFELQDISQGTGTRFVWSERLSFPWYFGGALGAVTAKPILTAVWRGNLRRLRDAVVTGTNGS